MRLIDIDALPEDCWWCGDALIEAINNAPTIEPEPCENCQEFDCYGCRYQKKFKEEGGEE